MTFIITSFIVTSRFAGTWKIAHISAIPKVVNPSQLKDYPPILILPVRFKIYLNGRNDCEINFCGRNFCRTYFCNLRPQLQKFLLQNFSKLIHRKTFFYKTFLNSVNCKNFFCKDIQNWSITKINYALKKKKNNFGKLEDINFRVEKKRI